MVSTAVMSTPVMTTTIARPVCVAIGATVVLPGLATAGSLIAGRYLLEPGDVYDEAVPDVAQRRPGRRPCRSGHR